MLAWGLSGIGCSDARGGAAALQLERTPLWVGLGGLNGEQLRRVRQNANLSAAAPAVSETCYAFASGQASSHFYLPSPAGGKLRAAQSGRKTGEHRLEIGLAE